MNLNTEYNILYFLVSTAIAIIISFFFYRKTNIPFTYKILLISLRTAGILLVFVLLIFSYITIKDKQTVKPVNVFLIDNSNSIFFDKGNNEIGKAFEIFKSLENNNGENKFYIFANDMISGISDKHLPDTSEIKAGRDGTNLTGTIETISKSIGNRKISSINIISDGLFNKGGNPLSAILQTNATVNYYLAGDTIQRNDLSVKNVFFNKTSYSGSNTQILAEINSYNYDKDVKINLFEDDILVQNKDIKVKKDLNQYNVRFDIKSESEGIKKYKLEIAGEPDELTEKNNYEEFFINFTSNKFRILVISGNPSPDFAYLKETVQSTENLEASFFTKKTTGVFYEGQIPSMEGFNILLLINFPDASTDVNFLEKLNGDLGNLNLPVFFIAGSNTDYERLKIIENYLPFTISNSKGTEEKTSIKFINDISRDKINFFKFGKSVNNIPEIFIPGITVTPKSGVQTILYSGKLSKPVLFYSESEKNNSASLLGYGFYKWRLNSSNTDSKELLGNILKGITINIGDKEKSKKITINTEEQEFSPYEEIKINGTINLSNPNGSESVKLQIYNNNTSKEVQVTKSSVNSFFANIKGMQNGEYFIKCTLFENGTETGNDIKKILIKESNREFKETVADAKLMNDLSNKTGGSRITNDNINEIKEIIYNKNKTDETITNSDNKLFLNSSIFILALMIVIFAIEWFLRKRLNLP